MPKVTPPRRMERESRRLRQRRRRRPTKSIAVVLRARLGDHRRYRKVPKFYARSSKHPASPSELPPWGHSGEKNFLIGPLSLTVASYNISDQISAMRCVRRLMEFPELGRELALWSVQQMH